MRCLFRDSWVKSPLEFSPQSLGLEEDHIGAVGLSWCSLNWLGEHGLVLVKRFLVMIHHLYHSLLLNPSGEAPVGVLWGNDMSHLLLPLAQVRPPLLGQRGNSGIFSNAALIPWAGQGSAGSPAGVLPSVAVLVGLFNARATEEGPGIWAANVGSSR